MSAELDRLRELSAGSARRSTRCVVGQFVDRLDPDRAETGRPWGDLLVVR